MTYDSILRSRRVVTPRGEQPATVCLSDGRIDAVTDYHAELDGPVTDLGDLVLLPGLVDTHVHVNEPGRTQWEGFGSATRAAIAGGVTTIIDMPLNSIPPTVTVSALQVKRQAADGKVHADVGFWGGAVPDNAADLPELRHAGVFGFKCFLVDSGVPEFPPLDPAALDKALGAVDALFLVHAESPDAVTAAPSSRRYTDFVTSRPPAAETAAIARVLDAARRVDARVHILHLSSAEPLPLIAAAKRSGVTVTVETCPHYLCLSAEDVPDGATEYKCCPPIRDHANQDQLWAGLDAGTIDCVVSDHSPSTPALKRPPSGDFAAAWGGISSLQIGLPAIWSNARARGYQLADVVRWMAQRPAEIAGLDTKGQIAVGFDADLVAFAPDESFVVDPTVLRHRHPVTPYAGRTLHGVVRTVWLRGQQVSPDGPPRGRLLSRRAR
ncbi:allantoinase AllB [Micromonospora sp. DT43]|uniref:allantoinase AllB n=1 Tax=Micromonospora sp. DT43 TaxID=3393440 RepID=UPI003CF8DD9C